MLKQRVSIIVGYSGWTRRYTSLPAENNNEEFIGNPSIRSLSAYPNLDVLMALKKMSLSRNLG